MRREGLELTRLPPYNLGPPALGRVAAPSFLAFSL
jgi:hypothetical protein